MDKEKAGIFLTRVNIRIDKGEFDKSLNIPFASRRLLKSLINSKIEKKVETGATPILSENNIEECVKEVRETAVETTGAFLKIGILVKTDGVIKVAEKWSKILNPVS